MNNETKWRKMLSWLRRNYPVKMKVTIRRVRNLRKKEPNIGYSEGTNRSIYIAIDYNTSFALQCDTLLHEWAHVMTWDGNDIDEHGEEWGLAYARIYRLFVAWDYGRAKPTHDGD